ncbi:MAG: methylenetetrahydrofolate reductase [NAD(P)H] [Herpetosiphon sp.]
MKVTERIAQATRPLISFEIIPPMRGGSVQQIFDTVEALVPFEPAFIDVTSHASEIYYEELPTGEVRRHTRRKRPGTIGICAAIQSRYHIDTVPHLLCNGFTREETEDALIELHYLGIQNVMALRGDDHHCQPHERQDRTRNEFASELVLQVSAMNRGTYLEALTSTVATDFCIGVAGYPEKHFEAPNARWDIVKLKQKVDAGAHFITTQMFFNNQHYFDFVQRCRDAGITVPIVPGLKILSSKKQLQAIPQNFFVEIPQELAAEIEAAPPERVASIGVEWAIEQSKELLQANVPGLHFYIMASAKLAKRVVEPLRAMM